MTTLNRNFDTHTATVWISATVVAAALAVFAPAFVVAMCVPAAGLLALLIDRRRTRGLYARLERLTESVHRIGRPAEPEPRADPIHADPLEDLEEAINRARAHTDSTIARLTETAAATLAVLNAVDAPIIEIDASGRVAMLNLAATRLLGDRPGGVVGVPLEMLLASVAVFDLLARAQRGEACTKRVCLTLGDTARVYEVAAVPVRLGNAATSAPPQRGAVLTIRDVHEHAQTLRLRTEFAANASHELRTPIASLRAAVETLRGPAENDPAMRARLVGMLETNTARLEEIVNDLLDLSRLENEDQPLRLETFSAGELADTLAAAFEPICRNRDLSIEFDIDESMRLRTDRTLLPLILRNLVDNATKFAFEGTTVHVTAACTGPDTDGDRAGVRFTVADRGIGIPLKHQQRIFERFYQVDESRARTGARRGSGLGLAIVRHALRRLGGEIRVESVWQEGTTMTVEIPECVEPGSA